MHKSCAARFTTSLVMLAISITFGAGKALADTTTIQTDNGSKHYMWRGRSISEAEYRAVLKYQEGTALLTAGKWQAAADKLTEVVAAMPDEYEAHCNLAIALISLGRIKEASEQADIAFKLAPDKPEPLLARAAVSQGMGHLAEALSDYKQFAEKYPNHRLAPQARAYITDLTRELNSQKIASRTAKSSPEPANDYFDYATVEAVTKWSTDKFPLKVFIPSDKEAEAVPGYCSELGARLKSAFEEWQTKTDKKVSFVFVDQPDGANIECRWTNDPTKVKTPAEGGDALILYEPAGIKHVKITLLTRLPGQVSKASMPNTIHMAALHEIGHSLGLIGHSPDPQDIMFCALPAVDQPKDLSDRDVRTLLHLYRPDVQLAVHVHDVPGPGNDKISLNNQGTELASQKSFALAADKFAAALKIDPTFEPARANLAACLNNLAVQAGKEGHFEEAVDKFKQALSLMSSQKDSNKTQASIWQNLAVGYERLGRQSDAEAARARAKQLLSSP